MPTVPGKKRSSTVPKGPSKKRPSWFDVFARLDGIEERLDSIEKKLNDRFNKQETLILMGGWLFIAALGIVPQYIDVQSLVSTQSSNI